MIGSGWYSVPYTKSGQGWAADSYTPTSVPEDDFNTPAGTHSCKVDGSVEFDRYVAGTGVAGQTENIAFDTTDSRAGFRVKSTNTHPTNF